jgi:hypothetical protein
LREAFLGSLDGSSEGALHRINRLHEDFYHPSNPADAIHTRIKALEDNEIKRTGFFAALSVVCGAVGFAITSAIAWLAGKR